MPQGNATPGQDKVFFLYYFGVICTGLASLFCGGACDHRESVAQARICNNTVRAQMEMLRTHTNLGNNGRIFRNNFEDNVLSLHELSPIVKFFSGAVFRIRGSVPLTNGSGFCSGSCCFRQ
jgi:hypothetical protein